MTDDNIETVDLAPILALDPKFGDLELELTSVKNALDLADASFTAEVQKLDAAIVFLYAMVESSNGPFTIADPKTAETVALAMLRNARATARGDATAAELEEVTGPLNRALVMARAS